MNKLHNFLDEQEQTDDDRFRVDDDQKANWVLRKIKQLEDEIKDVSQLVEAEVWKLEQFHNKEKTIKQDSVDYFQGLLAQYAADKRNDDPKFKSLKLPNGRIGFRKRQPKWNFDDETVLKVLEDNKLDDFIRVKKAPDKAQIKKAFNVADGQVVNPETGELIEGITVEEQEDNFNVNTD